MYQPIIFAVRWAATLFLVVIQFAFATPAWADPIPLQPLTLVDTLRGIPVDTVFDVAGSSGFVPSSNAFVGPAFTVSERTVLTEIGAFENLCNTSVGDPSCVSQLPLIVQIRPAVNGLPDLSTIIGSFELSTDEDSAHYSFESATLHVALEPGDYFALFAAQARNFGILLNHASSPFEFTPAATRGAILNPIPGVAHPLDTIGAVRILGIPAAEPVPEPSTLLLVGVAALVGFGQRDRRPRV